MEILDVSKPTTTPWRGWGLISHQKLMKSLDLQKNNVCNPLHPHWSDGCLGSVPPPVKVQNVYQAPV